MDQRPASLKDVFHSVSGSITSIRSHLAAHDLGFPEAKFTGNGAPTAFVGDGVDATIKCRQGISLEMKEAHQDCVFAISMTMQRQPGSMVSVISIGLLQSLGSDIDPMR